MVRKRDWGGITVDILEAAMFPSKKIRIMYRANLNFERFDRYFQEMLRRGLLESQNGSDGKASYVISEKGEKLLDCLRKAQDIFSS
jgi:predicted transcriptional regulator